MERTGRLQAVGLASLLLFSLLGAAGPFAGVAAADGGTVSFDASAYADGDTVTVTVKDGDLSTTEEYVVNVQSDTEGQEPIVREDIEDGVTSFTTDHPVAEINGDNKITDYEILYDNSADGSGVISSISRNANGTVDIQLNSKSDSDDDISYTSGETTIIRHKGNDQFSGEFNLTKSDTDGKLLVSDGGVINATYSDESANEDRIVNATIGEESTDTNSEPLSLGPITEFSTDSLNGTALSHAASVIEIPFSEGVSRSGGEPGGVTLGGNVTVAVDGENVTDRYALDADGSADGQIVVSSATPVDPSASVTVAVDAVNDSTDAETLEPGSIEATAADAVAPENGDANAYAGETVAFVADDANRTFDVRNGSGTVVLSGRTGNESQVFAFDTAARNWTGEYTIESVATDGGTAGTTDLALRELGLSVAVDDRNVTVAEGIDARVSAADAGRAVEVSLRDAEGATVDRRTRALDGSGNATVLFDVEAGNYTVTATDPATGATAESDRVRVVKSDSQDAGDTTTESTGDTTTESTEETTTESTEETTTESTGDTTTESTEDTTTESTEDTTTESTGDTTTESTEDTTTESTEDTTTESTGDDTTGSTGEDTTGSTDDNGTDTTDDDGTNTTTRDLELSVAVDDRNLTAAENIDARVSAADAGREIGVSLRDAEGATVDRRTRTLDDTGDAVVEFDLRGLVAAEPGNYTVVATDPATGATAESDRIRVVDADARTAAFRSAVVAEHTGDVVTVDVTLQDAEAATVTIRGPDAGFGANATVRDDGDGRVRLRFNTAAAADATTVPTDGGDVFEAVPPDGDASTSSDVVVEAAVDADSTAGVPDAGEYDLTVRPGSSAAARETDAGTLTLRQPAPTRLDTRVAPAGAAFATFPELSTAATDGRLTNATEVAVGDTVVHRLVAPGIAGELARGSGNTTEAFFASSGTGREGLYGLDVTNREPDANTDSYRLRLNEDTAAVVADAANDTYFVIYRSDGPPAIPRRGTAETDAPIPDAPAAGASLSATFTVHDDGPFVGLDRPNRTVTATHSLVTPRVDGPDPAAVINATNQSIAGTTTLAPGTEFDLRIRSANGTDTRTVRVVVDANRTWTATADFDDRRVGDNFTVRSVVETVPSADEFAADGAVRATLVRNTTTPTVRPTAATGGGGGGGGGGSVGGGGGGGGSGDDRGSDFSTESPAPTSTPTPAQPADSEESVVDSARQFLGGVVGTTVEDAAAESIRDRLLGFDVAVPVVALATVVVYVSRQG